MRYEIHERQVVRPEHGGKRTASGYCWVYRDTVTATTAQSARKAYRAAWDRESAATIRVFMHRAARVRESHTDEGRGYGSDNQSDSDKGWG